jgi:UDP-2-acetamido-3-amino-2,3-dideoxy-glucuronate N-acetyltransferase
MSSQQITRQPFVAHATAHVSALSTIGAGTCIWHQAQIRERAHVGRECNLGKNVYIDCDVRLGDRVKVQNNASLYRGAVIEDGVFIGPHVCLTNDKFPRAISPEGSLQGEDDWETGRILVRRGASLGAGTIVVTGLTIGIFALTGAGAVVTRDVPDYGLVVGNPARLIGYVCPRNHRCGGPEADPAHLVCKTCGWQRENDCRPGTDGLRGCHDVD